MLAPSLAGLPPKQAQKVLLLEGHTEVDAGPGPFSKVPTFNYYKFKYTFNCFHVY